MDSLIRESFTTVQIHPGPSRPITDQNLQKQTKEKRKVPQRRIDANDQTEYLFLTSE